MGLGVYLAGGRSDAAMADSSSGTTTRISLRSFLFSHVKPRRTHPCARHHTDEGSCFSLVDTTAENSRHIHASRSKGNSVQHIVVAVRKPEHLRRKIRDNKRTAV